MPSGRRRQQPDQPPPVFFLDRGLGRHLIAEAIRTRGYEALPMAEVYPGRADQRIADPDWMLRADQEGWVALTKDHSVVRDHRDVLAETTLRVFAYNNANLTQPLRALQLEEAVLQGFAAWRQLRENDGGVLQGDLGARKLSYMPLA